MNATRTLCQAKVLVRRVTVGALFGVTAVVAGCGSAPPAMTTTTERTTTQPAYSYSSPPPATVTTTRTQQYNP